MCCNSDFFILCEEMFVWIFLLWFLFYLFRKLLLRSNIGTIFTEYLTHAGFSCSFFHIIYETSTWNTYFYELFNQHQKSKRLFLLLWFNCGIVIMFIGQILSIIMLTVSLVYSVSSFLTLLSLQNSSSDPHFASISSSSSPSSSSPSSSSVHSPTPMITPIIPGINFPLKYLFDFWCCTFIVIVIHEFGHAAAASMERLQIQGFGVFFLFLFPGAYVRIEESIHYLPMYPQLRVYSAGVWHNFVMAILCLITLFGLPHVLSIGYISLDHTIPVVSHSQQLQWTHPPSSESQGVVVTQLLPNSALIHSIKVGDILVSINDKPIQSSRDFQRELTQISDFIESSLLSQSDIDLLKYSNQSSSSSSSSSSYSSSSSPSSHSFSHSHHHSLSSSTPGQYDPESKSGYIVRGYGSCASISLLEQFQHQSRQCCKQVFLPISSEEWHYTSSSSAAEEIDFTNTCYFLSPHNKSKEYESTSNGIEQRESLRNSWKSEIFCMPARDVQTPRNYSSQSTDSSSSFKSSTFSRMKGSKCQTHSQCQSNKDSHCIYPLTTYPTTLITLGILSPYIPLTSTSTSPTIYHYHEILYEGTPHELIQTLSLGSYRLRRWLNILSDLTGAHDGYTTQSTLFHFFSHLPDILSLYLWLCIQLNISVALLNMLPVSILDGGFTSPQFARILFPKNWQFISRITEYYGIILLTGNLLIGLIPLIIKLPNANAGQG